MLSCLVQRSWGKSSWIAVRRSFTNSGNGIPMKSLTVSSSVTLAELLLFEQVQDEYQRYHAQMVSTAMEGYANDLGEDVHLW